MKVIFIRKTTLGNRYEIACVYFGIQHEIIYAWNDLHVAVVWMKPLSASKVNAMLMFARNMSLCNPP